MKIILLTSYDPRDVSKWSGTITSIYNSLLQHTEPGSVLTLYPTGLTFAARCVNKVLKFAGIHIDCRYSTLFAIIAGFYLSIRLAFMPHATIVAVSASNLVPFLRNVDRRILYIADTTFKSIQDFYPEFKAYPQWLRRQGDANERRSLNRAHEVFLSSQWAKDSAIKDYGVPKWKIKTIPFGPNMPIATAAKLPPADCINLLFVSADWDLKNGDKVLDICDAMISGGVNVKLNTVGNTAAHAINKSYVTDHGRLDKRREDHLRTLTELYQSAHFLLLPSRAEAFGIVLVEAQAFGVLPVASDVGGIPSAICSAARSLVMGAEATPEQYAAEIMRYASDPAEFSRLSGECRDWHSSTANWNVWSMALAKSSHLSYR